MVRLLAVFHVGEYGFSLFLDQANARLKGVVGNFLGVSTSVLVYKHNSCEPNHKKGRREFLMHEYQRITNIIPVNHPLGDAF